MRFVLFCHAFTSCWNNGHAHFLRGVARELIATGHSVVVCEPANGWSRINALADGGETALLEAEQLVPGAEVRRYSLKANADAGSFDSVLDDADVVLVHEWNEPDLVAGVGRLKDRFGYLLFFLDAHHRAMSAPDSIETLDLDAYDAVLAFGEALRDIYRRRGWGRRALTWHEAADTALFRPAGESEKDHDLLWVGNWGDDERSEQLVEFLIEPSRRLQLRSCIHGVRYPDHTRAMLAQAGIQYGGWLANHRVPAAFARAKATVHVPRSAYRSVLPGIPTIRVFEALACGIPLVCSPWLDEEGLFPPGCYLQVANGRTMKSALRAVLSDRDLAREMSLQGLAAIQQAHTCRHRVEQLLAIVASLSVSSCSPLHAMETPA